MKRRDFIISTAAGIGVISVSAYGWVLSITEARQCALASTIQSK